MLQIYNGINSDIQNIIKRALSFEEISTDDLIKLLKVTGKNFLALQAAADEICTIKKKNVVTFIINRNINFTNICKQSCKFCSFSVSKDNKEAFTLSIEEIKKKVIEANNNGCSEVCIQGGINPALKYDYYLNILKTVKNINNNIHIHAFSPQEIFYLSQLSGNSIEDTLKELKYNGLDSIPGTAAEILVDDIRRIICPNKITTTQWIEIIKIAHECGIPTTSTIMYGHIEDIKDRAKHLEIIRDIQKETNGFTEFVPLPFVKEKPILSRLKEHPLKPSYGIDDLRLFSAARLYFNNFIDNIQCSWVKLGPKFAQISLYYGVNDFSGTLMEENISKSAGAEYGEYLPAEEIIKIIKSCGKRPAQRDTLYDIIKYY
ncbi:MAG: 7,8-didemethyl-8-hydroxy-5-deazariboflavin synthase subunit CofH [Promethearchaeota archaeon]